MENVIEKVQKLLTLSKNNSFEGESKAAMLAVQRLMAQHNLTMADIIVDEISDKEVVKENVASSTRLAWWYKALGTIIADNFRCYVYIQYGRGPSSVVFLGLKEDVELAKQVYSFAVDTIKYLAGRYVRHIRNQGSPTTGVRNDYIMGFLRGLTAQFKEQVNSNEWGLVLVKDSAVSDAYKNLNCTKGRRSKARSAGSSQAKQAGYSQGYSWQSPSGALN